MGKRKLTDKISAETHSLSERGAEVSEEAERIGVVSAADAPLFFLDKLGATESRRNRKRRERDDAEAAAAAKATAERQQAEARSRRRGSEQRMRKRSKTSTTAATTATTAGRTSTMEAAAELDSSVFDLWQSSTSSSPSSPPAGSASSASSLSDPRAPRRHSKLASLFTAHSSSSIVPASVATAASLPHPGQSFHPSQAAHSELLEQAVNAAEALRQQSEAIRRHLNPDLLQHQQTQPGVDDSSASLQAQQPQQQEEGKDAAAASLPRPPTVARRLTQTQRNRQQARRLKAALQSQAASAAALNRQLQRLPVIISSLRQQEKRAARRRQIIARLKATQPDRQPRLGPYEQRGAADAVPDVSLPEELSGSVRQLHVSLHVVRDAMRRIESRRLLESRQRLKPGKRRYKLKEYERYKDSKEEGRLPQFGRKGD